MLESLFQLSCRSEAYFIEKENPTQVFSREFYKIFKNTSGDCFCFLDENAQLICLIYFKYL